MEWSRRLSTICSCGVLETGHRFPGGAGLDVLLSSGKPASPKRHALSVSTAVTLCLLPPIDCEPARPAWSTMQMAVTSCETAKPTKWVIMVEPTMLRIKGQRCADHDTIE